jgi:hypothetical protein
MFWERYGLREGEVKRLVGWGVELN